MDLHHISQADLIDIIFDGRNKEYGAYELRKSFNRRLARSLFYTGLICAVLIFCYKFPRGKRPTIPLLDITGPIILTADPNEKNPAISIPRPHIIQSIKIKPHWITVPKIIREATEEEKPPENREMDNATFGNIMEKGTDRDELNGRSGPDNKGVKTNPPQYHEEKDFVPVEIESNYPGGSEMWKRYLLKNFHCPQNSTYAGSVVAIAVEFIVDRDGTLSDIVATSGPEEFREEALRVIKKSGKWNPAIQNGRPVKSFKKQPIIVQIEPE